jgi:hypothetical protein
MRCPNIEVRADPEIDPHFYDWFRCCNYGSVTVFE